ncbi:MAG TPA: cation diffusion facilitator family transporter, partial [Catalimonadaceae bacterium]|nr:cation diffusion facilitator family transporter [Catalimonadaceae bacterium]
MLIPVRSSFDFQKKLTTITLGLFLMKAIAWYFTGSLAVLSDTLEYSINVVSSFLGLYSLRLSSRPKDKNHPYGHGKVEFLSATMEGTLMIGSGIFLIYEITRHWLNPHPIGKLDVGLIFLAISGLINYWAGYLAVQKGEKNHSLALVASGRHMISDTYATAGILAGLVIMYLTGWQWVETMNKRNLNGLV